MYPDFLVQAILVVKKSVGVDLSQAGHILDYQLALLRIPHKAGDPYATPPAINR